MAPPEEEYKYLSEENSPSKGQQFISVEDEEKKLLEGAKNLENKDDFWISLSQ